MTAADGKRRPVSFRCDIEAWDLARATARGMLAIDPNYSLTELLESALNREMRRLEAAHNHGQPWRPATVHFRPGRRIDSRPGRVRRPITVQCDEQLWAQAKGTVRGIQTAIDLDYSIADVVEAAVIAEAARLQNLHNDGEPWPPLRGQLRRGRKIAG